VGKGGSVGQGVGVDVVVAVGTGKVGVGVDGGIGVAVMVSAGVAEGVTVGVAEGTGAIVANTVSLLLLASGSDTVQPTRFSIITNPIINQRLITRCFICLYSIRFT
jgi:hypothetical protein